MNYAFIGFGEAGQAFVNNWSTKHRSQTKAFDIKSLQDDTQITEAMQKHGILETQSATQSAAEADVIFSLVTADQATNAAASVGPMKKGALYLECNSVSPGSKKENAEIIHAAGGTLVDVAVMAPVQPALNKVPLLLSGEAAPVAEAILNELGMNPSVLDGEVGLSSSIKMIRSIMVKGMEALFAECVLSAVKAGVDETVLASLEKSFPAMNWMKQAGYNFERMSVHGRRRAAEMIESAKTIEELGLPNAMTQGTVKWQTLLGEMGYTPTSEDYADIASDLLKKI